MGAHSPITGRYIASPISAVASSQLIADWMATFGIDISSELNGIDQIDRYRCADSGLFFFKPERVCGSSRMYESLGQLPWYYPKEKWEYFQALDTIPAGSRIIEVGCGSGDFLELASTRHSQIYGLDINPRAISSAKAKGLNAHCAQLGAYGDQQASQFDVLCAFQLLEHLPNPLDFLEDALRLVRPNGMLIFATPNSDSFLRYQYTLLDMPPHHMLQWNAESYRYLSKVLPVHLEAISYEPLSSTHLPHFARSTSKYLFRNWAIGNSTLTKLSEHVLNYVGRVGWLAHFVHGQSMLVVLRKTGASHERAPNAIQRISSATFANLGCGDTWHPDWRNFDLVPTHPSIEAMNLLADWDIPDNSFQMIYSSHVLEHLPRAKVQLFLQNCWRVLQPGGILRIVVPDLEGICREYIAQIEAVRNQVPDSQEKLRWITLELLDQLTRTRSGGFMSNLWATHPLPEKDYIVSRFGEGAKYWIDKLSSDPSRNFNAQDPFENMPETSEQHEVDFRRRGEIHRWMYDEVSLTNLLHKSGFTYIRKADEVSSYLPDFRRFLLDTDINGMIRKPDSLFLEARKPAANSL